MDLFKPRNSTLSAPQEWLLQSFGKAVSPEEAMRVVACYACVRVISEQIATLPLRVYQKTDEGRVRLEDALYRLLNAEPNPYMTAYNMWRVLMVNLLLTGHAYCEVERAPRTAEPIALWPIPSKYVEKRRRASGEPVYIARVPEPDGGLRTVQIAHANMLELLGLSPDGLAAYRPLELLAESLGLAKQAAAYSQEYYANGSHPSGIITYPGTLRGEKREDFREELRKTYSGLGKRHRVMLLEEGMTYLRISAPMTDGQTVETRDAQVVEIARFFNVPPHKIMDMSRATWGNIEELNLSWINDTLMPYLVNIQQAVGQTLLFAHQRREGVYVEYDINALLRGRIGDRYAAYAQGRQWGFLSTNEIRARENLPDIGPAGDVYLTPLNMTGVGGEQQ